MKNLTYDNENNILEDFRESTDKVLPIPLTEELNRAFILIKDEKEWSNWIDSSSKSAPPPDFYNEKEKIMMELMRFDDQQTIDGKRHATRSKEAKVRQEIRNSGILDQVHNVKRIMINVNSDLSTNDDHNFNRYRGNFNRTVNKHAKKVSTYKENHPEYSLIFFILDETSGMYFENNSSSEVEKGKTYLSRAHCHWLDDEMVKTIKSCGADFFVWYKPHNSFESPFGVNDDFPKIVIYDIDKMQFDTIEYDESKMMSSEA